jgi:hypothetical protein
MARDQVIAFELSPALLAFRLVAGNANRHVNTIFAGLQALEHHANFRATGFLIGWSRPHTPAEWEDSKAFAYKMALIAIVDGINQYLRVLSRMPGFTDPSLADVLAGRRVGDRRLTIGERVDALNAFYSDKAKVNIAGHGAPAASKTLRRLVGPARIAMIYLLIYWRNIYAHNDYRFSLPEDQRTTILESSKYFKQRHDGVIIKELVERFDGKSAPTLADLSTMFSVCQIVLGNLDSHLLQLQTGASYANCLIKYLMTSSGSARDFLSSVWQYGGDRTTGRIHTLFLHNGANHDANQLPGAIKLTRKELHDLFGVGINKARIIFGEFL